MLRFREECNHLFDNPPVLKGSASSKQTSGAGELDHLQANIYIYIYIPTWYTGEASRVIQIGKRVSGVHEVEIIQYRVGKDSLIQILSSFFSQ